MSPERFNYPAPVTNINDIWIWFQWLFFYPGDYLLKLIDGTDTGRFLNLDASYGGGWLSGIVSFIIWWFFLSLISELIGRLMTRRSSYSRRRREKGERIDDLI